MSNPRQYPLVLGVNSKNQADQLIEASALKLDSLVVSSISAIEFLGLNLTGINITVPTGVYITTAIYYEGTGTFLPKPTNNPSVPVVTVYNPNTGTTNDSFPYAVNTTGPATAVSLWTYQGLRDRFFEIPDVIGAGNNILVYNQTNGTLQGFRVEDAGPNQVLGHDGAGNLDWVTVCGAGGPVCGVTAHDQLANVILDSTGNGTAVSHWTYNTLQSLFVEPSELTVYATTATTALVNYVRINLPSMQTITGPITFNAAVCGVDASEINANTLNNGTNTPPGVLGTGFNFGVGTATTQLYLNQLDGLIYTHTYNFNDLTATPAVPSHWKLDTLRGLFMEPGEMGIYATTAEVANINTSLQSHLNATGPSNDPHPQYTTDAIFNTHSGTVNVTSPNTTVSHWTYQRLQELFMEPGEMGIYTTTADFNQATATLIPQNTGTALGDLIYFSAGPNKFRNLPIGSDGQVLKVVGGLPVWATAPTGTSTVAVLADLDDVAITSPTSQHILRYSGATGPSAWINTQLGHSNLSGVVLDSTAVGQVGHYTIEFLNARYVQPATTALVNYFTTTESNNRYVATGTFYATTALLTPTATFNQATALLATTASLTNYTLTSTFNQATSVLTPTATFVQATSLLTPTSIFYSTTATLNNNFVNYTPTATFNQATAVLTPTSTFVQTTATLNNRFVNYTLTSTYNSHVGDTSIHFTVDSFAPNFTTTGTFYSTTALLTPLTTFNQATSVLATTASLANYTLTSTFNQATSVLATTASLTNYTLTSVFNQATALLTPTGTFVQATAILTPLTTFNQATALLTTTATFNQATAILTPLATFNQATSLLATTASLANYTLLTTFNQATSVLTPTATFYSTTATLLPKTGGTITGPLVINSNLNVTGSLIVTGNTTFVGTVNGIDATEIAATSLAGGMLGPTAQYNSIQVYTQALDNYLDQHIELYIAPTTTGTPGHWNEVQLTGVLKNTFLQLNATGEFITTGQFYIPVSVGPAGPLGIDIAAGDVLTAKDDGEGNLIWVNYPLSQTSFWDPSQFQENIIGPEAGQILILSGDLSSIDRSLTNISSVERHLSGLYGVPGSSIHHHLSSLDQRYLPASGVFSGVVAVQALSSVDYIEFDLSANVAREEGRLYWNDTYKTLELDSANQTSIMLGQEVVVRVLNNTAQTFTRGQVVYISGTQSNIPTIALATASAEATTHKGLGVLKQTLTSGQRGLMSTFGLVSGVDTSIYSTGDILYLGVTPGALTNVYSTAPSHPELIGSVVTVGTSSTGSILVQVQHGYEIQELHNVSRTPPSATGQVLVWNDTSGYYQPGSHNDLAGLTTGNPHTQYATLSGATFTGNVLTPSLSATNVTGAIIYGTSSYISTVSATTYNNLPVHQRIIPITILNPSSVTYYPLFYAKHMANIEEVNSVLVGGTSVTWSIWLSSDVSDPTTGTQLYDSKITDSLTTGNTETGVSISEGWVVLEVVGYSGSVGQLQLTFITD